MLYAAVPPAFQPSASKPSALHPSVPRLSTGKSPAATQPTTEPLAPDQAQQLLRALAEPIRLQVVQALAGGERCVCELTAELALSQSKLSFHLRVMKEAGLIHARQEGRWIYYRLDPTTLSALQNWISQLAAGCGTPAQPCG